MTLGGVEHGFSEKLHSDRPALDDAHDPSLPATLDFLVRCEASDRFADLLSDFLAYIEPLGLGYAAMIDMSSAHTDPVPSIWFTTFPPEWIDEFRRNRRRRADPVWDAARSNEQVFVWSHVVERLGGNPDDSSLFYRRLGLKDGISIPVYAARVLRPTIFLGAVRPIDIDPHTQAMLTVTANTFAARALRLTPADSAHRLTEREREILAMTAMGWSARRIGNVLDISEKTISRHLLNVRARLNAANTTHAVALAIRANLIEA